MATTTASSNKFFLSTTELPVVFHDVIPIEQEDSTNVCVIAYSDTFKIAHNYMRAILQSEEFSDRTLKLSALCLKQNPANYTIWHFRRKCLFAMVLMSPLSFDLELELQLASKFGGPNPKNYQIWYHRRALLEQVIVKGGMMEQEVQEEQEVFPPMYWLEQDLEYVSTILLEHDGKNYHAWSHRQWLLGQLAKLQEQEEEEEEKEKHNSFKTTRNVWDKERIFVEKLLTQDVRNNSAWNQRWFVTHQQNHQPAIDAATARVEVDYALGQAKLDPYNESPWRYLIGILKEQQQQKQDHDGHDDATSSEQLVDHAYRESIAIQEVLISAERDPEGCANLNSALMDLLEFQNTAESLEEALRLCQDMATKHDKIRAKYWKLVRTKELEERKKRVLLSVEREEDTEEEEAS